MKIQIVVNSKHEDQMALVRRGLPQQDDELLCFGDAYSNVSDNIESFIEGLKYSGIEIEYFADICIEEDVDPELFELCSFYNN